MSSSHGGSYAIGELHLDAELNSLPVQEKLLWICTSVLGFAFLFVSSWLLMAKRIAKFSTFSTPIKADHCSRVNSTVHSFIVVPCLAYGILAMQWGEHYEPLSSVAFLQHTLCITVGYFICDTVIILLYQVPLWGVFTAHHCIANTPYLIYMFVSDCPYGLFVLACFMLVEFTNITLNAQAFLEQYGHGGSRYYATAFYITFVGWIFCRIMNPLFMLYVIHFKLVPDLPADRKYCLVPGMICAYLINVFCIGVFALIMCKEVMLRWRSSPNPNEVAPLTENVRPINLSRTNIEMTDEEKELTMECPSRMLIHEAREKILDLELTVQAELERRNVPGFTNLENRQSRSRVVQE